MTTRGRSALRPVDPEDPWFIACRGRICQAMERYIAGRGKTCREMGRYDQAVDDFDRAIELDPAEDEFAAAR